MRGFNDIYLWLYFNFYIFRRRSIRLIIIFSSLVSKRVSIGTPVMWRPSRICFSTHFLSSLGMILGKYGVLFHCYGIIRLNNIINKWIIHCVFLQIWSLLQHQQQNTECCFERTTLFSVCMWRVFVAAALQSVFPQSQLATFMSLLKQDKEKQLTELSLIVSGIRLFNKDSNKGGESIQNCTCLCFHDCRVWRWHQWSLHVCFPPAVPSILNEAVPAAVADLESELAGSQRLAWRYTALLEKISEQEQPEFPVHPDLLKQALYNTRQHEAFLKFILVGFTVLHHVMTSPLVRFLDPS